MSNIGKKCMFRTLMEIEYEDYELSDEGSLVLSELTQVFVEAMRADKGNTIHEVAGTSEQAKSEKWHQVRQWHNSSDTRVWLLLKQTDLITIY